MDKMKHRRLQELDRSDFEIVDGEPDIRGWDVKNTNGQKIGEVEELIVDAQEKKVRYMVVDLDDNELKLDHRKVLIPIGLAELDRKDDDVLIPRISPQQFTELPEYNRDHLTVDVERRIFSTLERQGQSTPVRETTVKSEERKRTEKTKKDELDAEFYRHEYYNLDNLYKNRLHEARSVTNKNESEYERGLRLWERRSEGGIIADENRKGLSGQPSRETRGNYREIDEETRKEMVRNRRNNYQQRRYGDENISERNRNIDERRTDEGLDV
ncbi:MAG TPA: PRC-barrel domain-containing protein [Chitinophagaceae bacterium]|jgi:sporulation protein YlmC with PRC-barrel domain|nr:PRC-barrel domain-containing protein [Chitinophagaceae bacterium]